MVAGFTLPSADRREMGPVSHVWLFANHRLMFPVPAGVPWAQWEGRDDTAQLQPSHGCSFAGVPRPTRHGFDSTTGRAGL